MVAPITKQELPGQRIEVLGFIIGIAIRLPTEMQRQKIDHPGDHHWQRQMAPQEQEHQCKMPNKTT